MKCQQNLVLFYFNLRKVQNNIVLSLFTSKFQSEGINKNAPKCTNVGRSNTDYDIQIGTQF